MVAHSLRAEYDGSADGTGRGTPLIPTFWDGTQVAHTLDASVAARRQTMPDKNRLNAVLVPPIPFDTTQITSAANRSSPKAGDVTHPIGRQDNGLGVMGNFSFDPGQSAQPKATTQFCVEHTAPLIKERVHAVAGTAMKVRRLTPLECERLQGFPDGWTEVPYRGKPAADGPRYKALGNSMAVNCMSWIGDRIQQSVERNGG